MLNGFIQALSGSGVPFVLDAWTNAPQTDYGAVEVKNAASLCADDVVLAQLFNVDIWLYCRTDSTDHAAAVQTVLNAYDCAWRFVGRDYLDDCNLIRWHWAADVEEESLECE